MTNTQLAVLCIVIVARNEILGLAVFLSSVVIAAVVFAFMFAVAAGLIREVLR